MESAAIIKQKYLTYLGDSIVEKTCKSDLIIIDEAIQSIMDGNTLIDGNKPITDNEWFILISHYFMTDQTFRYELFCSLMKDALESSLSEYQRRVSLRIDYRGRAQIFEL